VADNGTRAEEVLEKPKKEKRILHLAISLTCAAGVWLIATFIFVFGSLIGLGDLEQTWLVFIAAVPVSAIVLLIFNCIWGKQVWTYVLISCIIWSVLSAVYLFFLIYAAQNYWLIFILGIPMQVIVLLASPMSKTLRKSFIKRK